MSTRERTDTPEPREDAPALNEDLAQRLNSCTTLPSPPAVVSQLLNLCEQPYLEMEELEHLLRHDPALTARLLRAANSPLYGYRRRASTLREAMLFLGVNGAVSLALTFTVSLPLQQSANNQKHFTNLWQRSALSALIATELGQRVEIKQLEQLFLTALLQDIGMFALLEVEKKTYSSLLDVHGAHHRLDEAERQRFGASHAEVGAWLLRRWRVPPSITDIVANSHTIPSSREHIDRSLSCVVLSWNLAEYLLNGRAQPGLFEETLAIAHRQFRSQGDVVSDVLDAVDGRVPELNQLFDQPVLDIDTRESMLGRARELMLMRNLQMIDQTETLAKRSRRLQARADALREQASLDGLTGLHSRASLNEMLEVKFAESIAERTPLGVLMIDLDHFKAVNDRHGHIAGDHVLKAVAGAILECVRDTDFAARYGGDEFIVLLSDLSANSVRAIGARILASIAERDISHPQGEESVRVQASIGAATVDPEQPFESVWQLIHAADQALYEAKNAGRNRLAIANKPEV